MRPKPLTLAVASVLVAVIAIAMALIGAFLLAIAAGGVATFDPQGPAQAAVALLGAVGVAVGVAGVASAVGLWLGHAWGWAGSVAMATIGSLGAAIAIASSGPQAPVLAGGAMVVAAAALLLAPRTRAASGVG